VSEAQIEQYKQFIQKQKADASQAVGFKFGEKQGDGSVEGKEKEEGSEAEVANGNEKDESLYG
jgi:hypothetical protein